VARQRERRRYRPLRSAILAASPHDTQPWLFAVSAGAIAVYADRARHLGAFDPFRREMHLGVGCALENLALAAQAFGKTADVRAAPGRLEPASPPTRPLIAARVALGPGQPLRSRLFDAIPRRHTNRGAYLDRPISAERLNAFADLVTNRDVRVVFLADSGARRELGAMIVKATERIVADHEMSMDSFQWIRIGRRDILNRRDGVTIDTSGASPLMTVAAKILPDIGAAKTDQFWLDVTRDVHTATAPLFGAILVRDRLDMAQAIEAGRAWQRLHLSATAHGLAAQPLNQPVEMADRHRMLGRNDEFGRSRASLTRADGWEPTFVFRMGSAPGTAARSPRRSLQTVITAPMT
jgi:nitroreductase